jgi:hypothetical protein
MVKGNGNYSPVGSLLKLIVMFILLNSTLAKVNILRDSHKLLGTPNREFERQFGGKTVLLSGLRLKSSKIHFSSLKFVLIYFH